MKSQNSNGYSKNAARFYGATPGNSKGEEYEKNAKKFYGVTPVPSGNPDSYGKNLAKFYGVTPQPTPSAVKYAKNEANFFGVTPPQSFSQRNFPDPGKPISQNTEFQINKQKFYSATPPNELLYKKNAKAFYNYSESPLVSAGKRLSK